MAENLKDQETKSAPPLTLDNVLEVVKNVRSWRTLGEHIYSIFSKLDTIQRQHVSDEACLKAVIEDFLSGKSGRYKQPSWRALIWTLYKANESQLAEHIISYAEPVQDPTMIVVNVIGMLENVAVERRKEMWLRLGIVPHLQLEKIYQKYSTEGQRVHACADIYVNCCPDPSWTYLCRGLYGKNEMTAARKAKTFIAQTDPTLTVENVLGMMKKLTDDRVLNIWRWLFSEKWEDISSKYSIEGELICTCADIYVNCCPDSSWEDIARGLYHCGESAAVEEVRSYLNPRDLTLTTERLVELFASANNQDIEVVSELYLETPLLKQLRFQMKYQNPAKRKEAYLDHYVHNHPVASWTMIAQALHVCRLSEEAAMVENTYIHVSERTRLNFEAAMKDGAIWLRNGSTFFLGPGGSGKTHTLLALLEEDPPVIRESTACAKKPIRAVAQIKVGVSGTAHFIRITDDHYSEMLANTAKYLSTVPMIIPPVETSRLLDTKVPITLPSGSSSSLELPESSSETSEKAAKETGSLDQLPVAKFGLKWELQCRMQAKSKTSEQLHGKDLMDVKDSGGQPMFHEVLPAFVTNTMFGILTVKLNEPLDSHPLVEYYINGSRIGEPFKSPFTHLQTFRHCLRVLQSTCKPGTYPKIIFVGTHKDLEHECQHEDMKEKNRKLQSIIPPEMKDNIIYNGESLLFPINAKAPGNDDHKMMGDLRQLMIRELQKLPKVKIPLQYFSLENSFRRLAKYQQKAILSIDECLKEATTYHFTRESLDDVLQYLHSLKLIMYYKDILPDVVFIDAQVLLNKITELVEYSIELRAKPNHQAVTALAGSLEKFKTCGIVTTEILSKFSSGYVPGLFEEEHLILLFEKLLIVAEIEKGEYLMPSLLEKEKVKIDFDSGVPAFLFYFGRNGPKLGVYCFLLASLITDAKWELLMEDNSPVQLSRNRVRFIVPGNNPGCITITDSFSTFFHVSIEFPDNVTVAKAREICEKVCPTIRETILTHIRRASHRLNYNNSIPVSSFLCSQHDENTSPHPATISNTGLLTCTTHPRSICSELTDNHRLWLGEITLSCSSASPSDKTMSYTSDPVDAGKLNIKDLRKVQRATWEARTKWYNIGLELEIDPETLDTIKNDNYNSDDRFRAMLTTWLKTINPRPTWEALADALRSPTVGHEHLTDLIESSQRR